MKKIIAIVAVIAAITACFCISTNAYENGDTIQAGTIITFGEEVNYTPTSRTNINFISNGEQYTSIANTNNGMTYNSTKVYQPTNPHWIQGEEYKVIKITSDYTIDNGQWAAFFTQEPINVQIPPLQKTVENTKTMFSSTLTIATAIIAWLVANQLALIGLYLYILVALIATGKRFITGV